MRFAPSAFQLSGAALFATSVATLVVFALLPAFQATSGGANFGLSGAIAVGLAWAANAPTGLAATKRWIVVVVGIAVAMIIAIELFIHVPFDFTAHDKYSPVFEIQRTYGVSLSWPGAVVLVLSVVLTPLWPVVARSAGSPLAPWWTVVLATAPVWATLLANLLDGLVLSGATSVISLAWLRWALARQRARQIMRE